MIDTSEQNKLCQLAEECSELAHAALKLVRAIDSSNPTPKSIDECRNALHIEICDVLACLKALELEPDDALINAKLIRWERRLDNVRN